MEVTNRHIFNVAIWGITNGFQKNILNESIPEEVLHTFVDRRELCHGIDDYFYSVELTNRYSIATIFIPTVKDTFDRRAFVAISLYTQKGYQFHKGLREALLLLADTYQQQISGAQKFLSSEALVNLVSSIIGSPARSTIQQNIATHQTGVYTYVDELSFENLFNKFETGGYRLMFFHNGSNDNLSRRADFISVNEFRKTCKVTIHGYDENNYQVELNNSKASSFPLYCFVGDRIIVTEKKSKRTHYETVKGDLILQLYRLFPVESDSYSTEDLKGRINLLLIILAIVLPITTIVLINPFSAKFPPFTWFSQGSEIEQTTQPDTNDTVFVEAAEHIDPMSNEWLQVRLDTTLRGIDTLPFVAQQDESGKWILMPELSFTVFCLGSVSTEISGFDLLITINSESIWTKRYYNDSTGKENQFGTANIFSPKNLSQQQLTDEPFQLKIVPVINDSNMTQFTLTLPLHIRPEETREPPLPEKSNLTKCKELERRIEQLRREIDSLNKKLQYMDTPSDRSSLETKKSELESKIQESRKYQCPEITL